MQSASFSSSIPEDETSAVAKQARASYQRNKRLSNSNSNSNNNNLVPDCEEARGDVG